MELKRLNGIKRFEMATWIRTYYLKMYQECIKLYQNKLKEKCIKKIKMFQNVLKLASNQTNIKECIKKCIKTYQKTYLRCIKLRSITY